MNPSFTRCDDQPFVGKVAAVFGATSGMGRETAKELSRAGAAVVVAARRESALRDVIHEIASAGGRAVAMQADVCDPLSVGRAVGRAVDEFGVLDILVNAAGTNLSSSARHLNVLRQEDWSRLLEVNLTGAFNTLQAALSVMRLQGHGLVVQVASVAAIAPDQTGAAYMASKSGVVALCRAAALEEHQRSIRVTAILPGLTATPMVTDRPVPRLPEQLEQALTPQDIAAVIRFLASLPARVYIPELVVLPGALQTIGRTMVE